MTKSIAELKISGTYRDDRHGDRVEAQKIAAIPLPPKHLTPTEKKVFTEVATLMFDNNSLASLDVYALEAYSVQLALFRLAKKSLQAEGQYIIEHTNKAGAKNLVPSPWLIVLKNSTDALLKFGAKLGMTPADRNKISKVVDEEPNEGLGLLR
jgi:P27 family predicted phage terminase small subunit